MSRYTKLAVLIHVIVLCTGLTSRGQAVTTNWNTDASGSFTSPANWDAGVPDSEDSAVFNRGPVAYTVTFPGGSVLDPPPSYLINHLRVRTNEVTFADNSSPFITTPLLTVFNPDLSIVVGENAGEMATLNTTLGSLYGAKASIGLAASANGTLNVTAGTLNLSGWLNVGDSGTGSLNVSGGGNVSNTYGIIANAEGSTGMAIVTGAGSTWTNSESITVGLNGTGTLTIEAGGSVSNNVGASIGGLPTTNGSATVTGTGSTWTSNGSMGVGDSNRYGRSTLTIEAGGTVISNSGEIGTCSGCSGTVIVTGADSRWENSGPLRISTGIELLGVIGEGSLTIGPGGKVSNSRIDLFPNSLVRLEGGTLSTGGVSFERGGQLEFEAGTLSADIIGSRGEGKFEWSGGTLHVGQFAGDLLNEAGTLAPGRSIGTTSVSGGYIQFPAGKLQIEIGGLSPGVEHDVVNVAGTALLNGQLDLSLLDGFVPAAQETFTVFEAESLFGALSNVANGQRLATADGIGSFRVHYGPGSAKNPNQIVLSDFLAIVLPGDYNSNGAVDAADYTVWRDNLGTNFNLNGNGDETGDSMGIVDMADYNVWKLHFGESLGNGGIGSAVPEPSTLLLLVAMAGFGVFANRRR